MIYFLDTSALVKRYVAESGSERVRKLFRRKAEIAVARIDGAEAYAALARAVRMNVLTAEERDRAFAQLELDLAAARIVEIRRAVVVLVRELRGAVATACLRRRTACVRDAARRRRSGGGSVVRRRRACVGGAR